MALNSNFSDFFEQPAPRPRPQEPKPVEQQPAAVKPADKFAGVPAWTDIQAKPEFKALPPAKQAEAKQAYFDYWIAPRVGDDAAAIREQFIGAQPAPEAPAAPAAPQVDDQAGKAAFGIYPSAKSAKPKPTAAQLLEQPGAAPEQDFVSRVPARPEVRRAFEAAWNAATPAERAQMEAAPGWTGQLARERAGFAKQADEARAKSSESLRTTLENLDPRAEYRAARLRAQGEDPRFAERAAREGARRGALPGQEIKALGGTVQESTYDFDTARMFDPNRDPNGANNALVRGVTKGAIGIGKTYAGLFQFQADVLGFDRASKSARRGGDWMRGQEEAIGERGDFLTRNLEGAVSSIAQQLPLLITGVGAASQAIPLAGMALQSFGQEYSDGRAEGQDTGQAATRAAMFAAFEVVGEKFGLGQQMEALRAAARGMPTSEIANLLFSALKKEVPGELLTTTGQFSVDKFAGGGVGLNPNATFNDYMKQVADTIAQTIMQSGLMGAGTTGVSTAVRYARDGAPTAGVAAADAEEAKRNALAKWAEFSRGNAAPQQTVDGRVEPTLGTQVPPAGGAGGPMGPGLGDESLPPGGPTEPGGELPPFDPLVQTADEIVLGLAEQAGIPTSTVLPGAQPPAGALTQADQDALDFAEVRFQQLREKRDGTDEEPGPGLSPSEEQELQDLVQARGNPAALRAFYGIPDQGAEDVRQTQESLDGSPSGAPPGQQDAAQGQPPGQVSEQPGQQPNEDGQAQGLGQAIDGLGALFGETEAEREARLEREAIQGESAFQDTEPTNDDDIPFDLGPPRTEKEARQRKEQQANEQAGQAQQAETPREETLRAPAAPPADVAATGAPAVTGVEPPAQPLQVRGQEPRFEAGVVLDALVNGMTSAKNIADQQLRTAMVDRGLLNDGGLTQRGYAFMRKLQDPNTADPQALIDENIGRRPFPKPAKPKTEKEAKQQRLADKPLPEWTQRKKDSFPDGTSFEWEQDGDNVVLVTKVGDKVVFRQIEGQVRDAVSYGSMMTVKALVEEKLRAAGVSINLAWTPEGGDTSVQDARDRKENRSDERSRASNSLNDAIERAGKAGATETKSKLVGARIKFDNKSMGPAEVRKLVERADSDIEKETAAKQPASEEERLVVAVSEITFNKGTVQDFLDKYGKAAFNRALQLGYIDNKLDSPGSRLFATNTVVYDLQRKYYDFPSGKRPVRKKAAPVPQPAPAGATPAAGAGSTQPAQVAPTSAAPTLEGVKVKFDVLVEDTGQTASIEVDAATQMKEYDEREAVLRELIACLQK
jgi:hypothetical protein